jgi:hypothetical protein
MRWNWPSKPRFDGSQIDPGWRRKSCRCVAGLGMHPARRSRHDRVAATLAALRDDEMAVLVGAVPTLGTGVGGGCARGNVDGVPVFVKRVPITDRELADPHSTARTGW